MHSELNGV